MRRLALALLLLLVVAAAGCGAGATTTETRRVAAFDRIDVDASIDVDVVPGDAGEVKVIAGENVIDRVSTESADGVLRLSIRDRGIVIGPDPFDDVRVQVSAGGLEGVRVQGSSDVGLGRIDARELSIEVDGSGDVEAAGTVDNLIVTVQGSGDADLEGLEARTATVSVEGSGDVGVNVRDRLDVTVHGSGDVSYRGQPRVSQSVSGSGEVRAG